MSAVADELEERKRKEMLRRDLHAKINSGEVAVGPLTVHRPVEVDRRDLRDPAELGRAYLAGKGFDAKVPDYDPEPTDHSYIYQAELRERAAAGDKFAISVLTTGQPGDEAE